MNALRVGGRRIGPGHPAYIIAEIGSNHDQSLAQAKRLVDAAAKAGADAVKFQSIQFAELFPPGTPASTRRLYDRIQLPYAWYEPLFDHARARGVEPFSCPTSLESVHRLEAAGVRLYKIASPQTLAFPQLLEAVARTGKPSIVSTGYCEDDRIARAVAIFRRHRAPLALLHCNVQYPTPAAHVGLRQMAHIERRHRVPVGFSDHTRGAHFAVAAVALGACVIEKHVTFDRRAPGPDHAFAMEMDEFADMVRQIREVESGLADRKTVTADERALARVMRYAAYASRALKPGERLSTENIRILRSRAGLSAEEIQKRPLRLTRPVAAGRPIPAGAVEAA